MHEVKLKSLQSIGELIHHYRIKKGYSQKDLADKLHVTISAISSWERGNNKPSLDIALEIANDLGITLDEFFLTRSLAPKLFHLIHEVISFNQAYVEIDHVYFNEQTNQLHIQFLMSGLTLTPEIIDYYSQKATFVVNDTPLVVQRRLESLPEEKLLISPELDASGMYVRRFHCEFSMPLPKADLRISLECNDQQESFLIRREVISLLINEWSSMPESNASILASDQHQEVLLFLSKNHHVDSLSEYIQRLYHHLQE